MFPSPRACRLQRAAFSFERSRSQRWAGGALLGEAPSLHWMWKCKAQLSPGAAPQQLNSSKQAACDCPGCGAGLGDALPGQGATDKLGLPRGARLVVGQLMQLAWRGLVAAEPDQGPLCYLSALLLLSELQVWVGSWGCSLPVAREGVSYHRHREPFSFLFFSFCLSNCCSTRSVILLLGMPA